MTIDSLIQTCKALGIKLALKGDGSDRLVVDAPKGALTPSLRDELAARKPQLIAFLKNRNQTASQPQASTAHISETEGRAPASHTNAPEARPLIQEQPLSVTSSQFEGAESLDDATRQLRTADSPTERAAAARKLGI